MAKKNVGVESTKSIWDLVEKVERKPLKEPILPISDWVDILRRDGELLIFVVYKRDDVKKFGFDESRFNKDVFLRSTVNSALWKVAREFKSDLFVANGRHKRSGCGVFIVSTKERLSEHGFDCRLIPKVKPKRKKRVVERVEEEKEIVEKVIE